MSDRSSSQTNLGNENTEKLPLRETAPFSGNDRTKSLRNGTSIKSARQERLFQWRRRFPGSAALSGIMSSNVVLKIVDCFHSIVDYSGLADPSMNLGHKRRLSATSRTKTGHTPLQALEPRIVLTTTLVALEGGNLVITDSNEGNTDDDLSITYANGDLVISDPNALIALDPSAVGSGSGTHEVRIDGDPTSNPNFSGNIIVNSKAGNDSLTVDFSNGAVSREVYFNADGAANIQGDE